jgi:lipid II:glycine glycyltransferase (peptidoglycan interpeptide bridge formation enzyme)
MPARLSGEKMDDFGHVTVEAVPPAQWTTLAATFADCTYEQVYEYCNATAAQIGGSAKFFRILCDNMVIGAAAVRLKTVPLLGRGIAYISAGPLTREASTGVLSDQRQLRIALKALKQELVDRQGHILRIRLPLLPPLPALDVAGLFTDLEFRSTDRARKYRTSVIDLTQENETLRSTLNPKWRTDLKFAQKAGLSIDSGTGAELQLRFERLFNQMHRMKGFSISVHPGLFFGLGAECTGLEVMIAQRDGMDAAGHVFSKLGDSAIYLFGAANELGRQTKAAYLLNWSAILLAKQRGALWYDLGGIDPDANPGVYRFKSRMGGQEMSAVGPYEAQPSGMLGRLIDRLELVRSAVKSKRPGKIESAATGGD